MTPQHVTSLELSQRLKALGVPQNSIYYWVKYWGMPNPKTREPGYVWDLFHKDIDDKVNEYVSAYLSNELGEMLPDGFKIVKKNKKFGVQVFLEGRMVYMGGRTMTQAMGAMLVHLLENNLITLEKGGEV